MKCNVDIRPLKDLADIQTGPFGSQLHKEDYVAVGTPIVTVEHLGNRIFTEQNLPKVSDGDRKRLEKYLLSTGDIVFSRVGSVDRCSYVDECHSGWMFSGRCLRIRPSECINPLYLYYYFCLEEVRQFVRNIAVGATMPSINTKLLGEVPVSVPSIQTQRRIAAILSALDDKIELNNKINANLEQQAQALFNEICKNGDSFSLADILEVCYGKDHKRLRDGGVPCYGTGGVMRYVERALYEGESVLIPRKGSLNNVMYVNEAFWTVDTLFYTRIKRPNIAKLVYFFLCNLNLAKMNVGSAVPSMTTAILNAIEITLPDEETCSRFERIVSPMFLQIQSNKIENCRLAKIRDVLLQALIGSQTVKVLDL